MNYPVKEFELPATDGYAPLRGEGFPDGSVYLESPGNSYENKWRSALSRKQAEALHSWLQEHLDATETGLPTKPYAVIDAECDYGNGPFRHRLVLIPPIGWIDKDGNDHSPSSINDFEIRSEGLDL